MSAQIFWGSVVLGICAIIHLGMIIGWAEILNWYETKTSGHKLLSTKIIPIGATFAVLVFAHTISVWLWAGSFIGLGAISNTKDAIYFSLVTYTTVGYGDVVLSGDFKIFGAMESVSGLLNFGVSTAFLFAVLARLLPDHLRHN